MDDLSKMIGENGCEFVDNSATNSDIYMIHVLADTVFTVLSEAKLKGGTETDVMTSMNLTGKTIPTGAILTPYDDIFSDISISSGSVMVYRLGR